MKCRIATVWIVDTDDDIDPNLYGTVAGALIGDIVGNVAGADEVVLEHVMVEGRVAGRGLPAPSFALPLGEVT